MVQLSQSSPTGDGQLIRDIKSQSEHGLSSLQSSLSSTATPLQVYETYLENGYVSLKHKIRNIEKKKVKLEDYRDRLRNGEELNQDQLEAVQKYEEVLHNLEFAKELQKTFSALNQDLIKAQKKSLRREQVQRLEAEKKRLHRVLQIQYLLQSFSQDHVQGDFKDGLNGAMHLSFKEQDYLTKFAKLICHKRFKHMSLEDEMDQSAGYFWNLLEGNEKTVAGTTYKHLKDLIARMLDCGYFENVPNPPPEKKPEVLPEMPLKTEIPKVTKLVEIVRAQESFVECVKPDRDCRELSIRPTVLRANQMRPTEVQKTEDVKCIKPEAIKAWPAATMVKLPEPKRWQTPPSLTTLTKPWQGPVSTPQPEALPLKISEPEPPKERRERVQKQTSDLKPPNQVKEAKLPAVVNGQILVKKRDVPAPICVGRQSPTVGNSQVPRVLSQPAAEFCSSPTLPKDPELRKQKINDLIDEIKGTYNFMQDSMLDFEFPPKGSPQQLPKGSPQQLPPESPPKVLIEAAPIQKDPIKQPQELSPVPASEELELESDTACPVTSEPADLPSDHPSTVRSPVNLPASPVHELEAISAEHIYVTSPRLTDPPLERNLTPINLPSSRIQSPKTPTNVSILQLQQEETALSRSPTMSPHTSPFQSMPAVSSRVFKVNAPLRKEIEVKEDLPYPEEYQQTFSTASTQTLPHGLLDMNGSDPRSLIQEPLPGPYSSGASPVNSGNLPCYTSTPNILPRISQPCMTRGGAIRGTSRGGRILANGYRCQTTFKGPETFRGAQCVPNGMYGHGPCPGRDFPVTQVLSRDTNAHLCHKRSVTPSTRSTARNWNDSQLGSPEHEESFNSTDSGQGDSRSMTSVDMSINNQATILPVHVYPLPQQMRVAFSAARTSNFAPGTLDQPITFDLLLNNLGDTFDFQMGRFMCPVNGTYVFIFHMLKLAVNVPLYVNLMKNEEVMVSAYANDGAPDHETASNHAVLQLFQGDQIWLRLHRGAIYGSSWKYSTFSGYLLYQD
ncbi:caprin-2 [Aquarana catesbeiana]|uniref:caprin-2 n=1 Tax=Aquarana catesbeiana TaxID=8400 RepID=UPI003CC92B21